MKVTDMLAGWRRGTIFKYDGIRLKAQDDQICGLLADAAFFEAIGSCSLKTAIEVAIECQRLTLADLPIPVGMI
jgi:hypothetical protein